VYDNEISTTLKYAKAIAWDTCHKIYVAMDDQEVQILEEQGYGDDMLTSSQLSPEEMYLRLRDWYDNACPLRFIEAVSTATGSDSESRESQFHTLVPQGEDW